jgi:hypothetical protein
MKGSRVEEFLSHFVRIKMFHFQTTSAFAHTKVDAYTAKFLANLDAFFEVYQGEFGRLTEKKLHIKVDVSTDSTFATHLQDFIDFLVGLDADDLPLTLAPTRDQMAADAKQLIYLLSFK